MYPRLFKIREATQHSHFSSCEFLPFFFFSRKQPQRPRRKGRCEKVKQTWTFFRILGNYQEKWVTFHAGASDFLCRRTSIRCPPYRSLPARAVINPISFSPLKTHVSREEKVVDAQFLHNASTTVYQGYTRDIHVCFRQNEQKCAYLRNAFIRRTYLDIISLIINRW